MIKKVLGTAGTRLVSALLTLIIVFIAAKNLGSEQYGNISLLIVGIAVILLINNFVGGGALVYFSSREKILELIVPSYIWGLIISFVCSILLIRFKIIPNDLFIHLLILSLFQSLNGVNNNILLGYEKIKEVNILSLVQVISFLSVFSFIIFILRNRNLSSYITALYISYILVFMVSIYFTSKLIKSFSSFKLSLQTTKKIFKLGTHFQIANIAQFFNYRLNYFLIEHFLGSSSLGVYTAGNQLSEGMWLLSKSISTVQYSKLSNTKDQDYATKLTIRLLKVSFIVTLLLLIVLLSVPSNIFILIFGEDFTMIKPIIFTLAIGILSISLSTLLSSYFSSIGKPQLNAIASIIGLVITVTLGFTLIPLYGLIAAGFVASGTYLAILVFQVIYFFKISGSEFKDFIPTKDDIQFIKSELKNLLKKQQTTS